VAWIGGASAVRLGLRVISVAILARLLTPQEYGIVAGALVAMAFATMIYGLGLAPTLIQRKEVRAEHTATAFSASLFMAVLAGVGMWCAAPLVAELLRIPELKQVLKVLALLTPFGAFNALCEALLARNIQVKSVALRPLFSFAVSSFFVAIPMAWYGFGYWSLVGMQAVETIVSALTLGFAARRLLVPPGFSRSAFDELWRLSLGFTLNQPFVYLATNGDNLLIGRFLGAEVLGLYTRASFITTTATNLFNSMATLSIFPAMAEVQDDQEKLRNGLVKALSAVAFVTLPATTFCIIFPREIVGILLGPHWDAAVTPFAILSATLYLRLAWRCCAAVFQALGRPKLILIMLIVRVVALILGIWWARLHGLPAVCAAVLVGLALVFIPMLALMKRVINISLQRLAATHLHPLAISLLIAGTGVALKSLLADMPGLIVLAATLVVLLASLFLIALFNQKWVFGSYGIALFHVVRDRP
jgi:PST family polysaccharide transporter